ncbi:hypothetical protein PAXINDRAFT_83171 [Paxillus involutus ATCC 200175]|uniref:Cytochrome P450 n=1 Tax=Paxillus involutus ATCC 200175 TaxID=664439 RepID=A0A0C9STS1_PAXIN|nr:hypothetical protein PAXINDRAFT_83171 [Paxillus involutus ATCC 200175]
MREVLRWRPVAPLGKLSVVFPHATTANDVCRGMFIPNNTTIAPNLWAMLHDPEVCYEPEEFIPERFLPTETRDACPNPFRAVWGFGRRICPSCHLADTSLWMVMAGLL